MGLRVKCNVNTQRLVRNKKVEILIRKKWVEGYIANTNVWKAKNGISTEHVMIRYAEFDSSKNKIIYRDILVKRNSKNFRVVRNRGSLRNRSK